MRPAAPLFHIRSVGILSFLLPISEDVGFTELVKPHSPETVVESSEVRHHPRIEGSPVSNHRKQLVIKDGFNGFRGGVESFLDVTYIPATEQRNRTTGPIISRSRSCVFHHEQK